MTTFDVCVVGGGVAGVAAALQAGHAGAKTVLIERASQVGGNMTQGGVNWPGLFHAWGKQIISGYGWELVVKTVRLAGGTLPDFTENVLPEHWRHQIRVNIPLWVAIAEEELTKAGVKILYGASPFQTAMNNDEWELDIAGDGDALKIRSTVLIDATGNGSLAALCGAERMRDENARQPGSYTYLLDPHAVLADLDMELIEKNRETAIAESRLLPNDFRFGVKYFIAESQAMLQNFTDGPDHGTTVANYVDLADNTTAALRTDTNMRGRAAMLRAFRFLKSQPGLEKTTVVWTAPEVGVRETWRVVGDYVLTGDDYVSGRVFDDSVCYAFYPVDIHDAKTGIHPKQLSPGTVPTVPQRSLIAKGIENVLVAGRCISSDRAANSGLRVQAACMATGQAAGETAALAAKSGCSVRNVPIAVLKNRLTATGHIVPSPSVPQNSCFSK